MIVMLSAALMVFGMIAVINYPLAGIPMIGLGLWLFGRSGHAERYHAASLFWGLALAAMVITAAFAIMSALFG